MDENREEGIAYVYASDFGGHGRAYQGESGLVTLYVHSNCNYTFRIKVAMAKRKKPQFDLRFRQHRLVHPPQRRRP
jgi:hypothetical protein